MKKILIFCFALICVSSRAQTNTELLTQAEDYLDNKSFGNAIAIYEKLLPKISQRDSLYQNFVGGYAAALYLNGHELVFDDKYEALLDNSEKYLKFFAKHSDMLPEEVHSLKYVAYKNIVVAAYGLGKEKLFEEYKRKLYEGYKMEELPKSLNGYFNFHKTVYDGKNIWGYEWFEELPEDRNSRSFTKQVYYVYSRDENGRDKDQLFTLHTIMFHKLSDDDKTADYILTKKTYTEDKEISETLTAYYFDPVDYKKLYEDVKEVIDGNYTPLSRSVYPR